jgi:hypothetical protein
MPKYRSTKKMVRTRETRSPRRELAKIREKPNSKLKKMRMKKAGTAPVELGSIK